MTEQHTTPNWSLPIEAIHTDGRCRTVKVGQINAGIVFGNDHWLWTADGCCLDSTPGAIAGFWSSSGGAVSAYPGWRIRNSAETDISTGDNTCP